VAFYTSPFFFGRFLLLQLISNFFSYEHYI
jgi:hypothetical protein